MISDAGGQTLPAPWASRASGSAMATSRCRVALEGSARSACRWWTATAASVTPAPSPATARSPTATSRSRPQGGGGGSERSSGPPLPQRSAGVRAASQKGSLTGCPERRMRTFSVDRNRGLTSQRSVNRGGACLGAWSCLPADRPDADLLRCALTPLPMHSGQRRQAGSCASASWTVRRLAAVISSTGTHSGNGISVVRWAPDAVCSSSTAAKRLPGKRSATRTRAGHSRRWMRVIFPLTRRVAITSGELSTQVSTAKISWPDPCPHQLPRIGSPATCSARLGTGPRADCNTTPCSRTHSSGSTIVDSNTRAPRPPSAKSPRPLSRTRHQAETLRPSFECLRPSRHLVLESEPVDAQRSRVHLTARRRRLTRRRRRNYRCQ